RPGLRGIGAAIHGMAEKIRLRLLRLRRYGHLCQPAIYGGSRSRSACGNTKGSHRAQPHPCLAEPIHLTYQRMRTWAVGNHQGDAKRRSEEHTSELQSLAYLVCRLLLEKKKNK